MKLITFDAFKHIKGENTVVLNSVQLKDLQSTLLNILDDFLLVCEENHIEYFLGGGTCLGAFRNKKMIPWDDDIDINMSRQSYERFIPAFQKRFGNKYTIQTPENTDNYTLLFARIRLNGTCVRTRDDFPFSNEDCGAFIEIFIGENTYNNCLLRFAHGIGCMVLGFALSCRKFYRDIEPLEKIIEGNTALLRTCRFKAKIGKILSFISVNTWRKWANNWGRMCKNNNSLYISFPAGRQKFFHDMYQRADLFPSVETYFEGKPVRCPYHPERYLSNLYGSDFLVPPAQTDQEKHIYFSPFFL